MILPLECFVHRECIDKGAKNEPKVTAIKLKFFSRRRKLVLRVRFWFYDNETSNYFLRIISINFHSVTYQLFIQSLKNYTPM